MIMKNKYGKILYRIKSNDFTLSSLTEEIGKHSFIKILRKNSGSSSYNLTKRFIDGYEIISKSSNNFSILIIFLTLISLVSSFIYLASTLYYKFNGNIESGFTGIVSIVALFGSIILMVSTFNMILILKLKKEIENNFNLENIVNEKINFKNKIRK